MLRKQLFVPGRLCLFGEHSDWAGFYRSINPDITPGYAIVTGIEQGIYATVEKHEKLVLRSTSIELRDVWEDLECEMQSEKLKMYADSASFFSYVAGVASYICENYNVGGIHITITQMTLPIKSGLSSSAAICVLIARAFNELYELNLSTAGEMMVAYKGELRAKSRCGRLDQACAFGIKPVMMKFDGEDVSVKPLVVKEPLHWVFADLMQEKDTVKILSDLNKCFPFPSGSIEQEVHSALGIENERNVRSAIQFIKEGDGAALGELMTKAQKLFDRAVAPVSPEELSAPSLHLILNDKYVKSLTYGGKGVGSQGDGSVQFIAKDENCQTELVNYLKKKGMSAYSLTVKPRHRVTKAVIPVAGFGTRLYPATRTMKKEFMPIVDSDRFVKPLIHILLEQLYDCGIEEICVIVGSDSDILLYRNYFESPLPEEHLTKLPLHMREYENKIAEIGKRIIYRVQQQRRGFGHAVYQSHDFTGGEPALLLLGDVVYHSNTDKACSTQLIEAYESIGKPVVSIKEIPVEQVVHYGVMRGSWEDAAENVLKVSAFAEKPSVEYAKDFLKTKRDTRDVYLSVFGQYIITSEVYSEIRDRIDEMDRIGSEQEIGLTEALEALTKNNMLYGAVLDGEMFDIGNSEAYVDAIRRY